MFYKLTGRSLMQVACIHSVIGYELGLPRLIKTSKLCMREHDLIEMYANMSHIWIGIVKFDTLNNRHTKATRQPSWKPSLPIKPLNYSRLKSMALLATLKNRYCLHQGNNTLSTLAGIVFHTKKFWPHMGAEILTRYFDKKQFVNLPYMTICQR